MDFRRNSELLRRGLLPASFLRKKYIISDLINRKMIELKLSQGREPNSIESREEIEEVGRAVLDSLERSPLGVTMADIEEAIRKRMLSFEPPESPEPTLPPPLPPPVPPQTSSVVEALIYVNFLEMVSGVGIGETEIPEAWGRSLLRQPPTRDDTLTPINITVKFFPSLNSVEQLIQILRNYIEETQSDPDMPVAARILSVFSNAGLGLDETIDANGTFTPLLLVSNLFEISQSDIIDYIRTNQLA
jgi:hypothetical protein